MILLGFSNVLGHLQIWNGINLPDFSHLFASSGHYYLLLFPLSSGIDPDRGIIYGGIKILFNIKTKHPCSGLLCSPHGSWT